MSNKNRWVFLVKLTLTVTILAYLLIRIDLSKCAAAIKQAFGPWLLAAFLVNFLALLISSLKWDRLLRGLGVKTSKWMLIELYMIGFFASSFLPGVVGGDVVRWHLTGSRIGARLQVAATILAERVTGLLALVVICATLIAASPELLAKGPVLLLLGTIAIGLTVGLTLSLNRKLATTTMYLSRRSFIAPIVRPLYRLHRTLRTFPPRPLIEAMGYSFVFYLICGLILYLICNAFGVGVSFLHAISVQLLVSLLSIIPISVGGLGLPQAGDVYLFGLLGVAAPTALGISIVRQLINYSYSLAGGVFFIRWRDRPPLQQASKDWVSEISTGPETGGESQG